MRSFTKLEHPICHSKEAEVVSQKYMELDTLLTNYEEEVFSAWVNSAEEKSLEVDMVRYMANMCPELRSNW